MQDLKLTLIQANQFWEDKQANLELYDLLIDEIDHTHLIILPEMFQTGFSMHTELAEDFLTSSSIQWLKQKAIQKKAAIYTSLMIRDLGKTTNRGVFVFPNGEIEFYDKQKTFTLAGENEHFDRGRSTKIVNYLGWKLQLNICYDLRFPEILRNQWNATNASASYDVLLLVANWPAKRGEHWRTLLKARAIENQCYVAGVNRVGKDHNNFDYSGDSQVFDMLGKEKNAITNEQSVISVVLSHSELAETRKNLPFLQDQNPKLS